MIEKQRASESSLPEQKMTLSTKRQKDIARALTLLIPGAPFSEAEVIRLLAAKRQYKRLPASTSVWLAAVAHIRHVHTDYDALLNEGYDQDSARHFVLEPSNEILTRWRATRFLDPHDSSEETLAQEDETR
jgi:hypothetical protein